MGGLVTVLTGLAGWVTSAGLIGLLVTLAYREWSEWRARSRERESLLYLLDKEINENEVSLSSITDSPVTASRMPASVIQSQVWEDVRVRLAQLISNRDEFQKIAIYYLNIRIVRNMIDHPAMSDADKVSLVPPTVESTRDMGNEVKVVIGKYSELAKPEYAVIVDVQDADKVN